jgi:hypothetical protein
VLTERKFYEHLGWPDQRIIQYVAHLLANFADVERVYGFRDELGRPRTRLSEMLLDAETQTLRGGERDAHRQIGDFTLFMMGLFPEHLTRLRTRILVAGGDVLLDYVKVGKRSYRIVAELPDDARDAGEDDAPLFRRLSEHFELCVAGLGYVREELRRRHERPWDRFRERFLN